MLVPDTVQRTGVGHHFLDIAAGKYSITVFFIVCRHIEVDRTVALIGKTGVKYTLYELYLLYDMAGSPGLDAGREGIEPPHRVMIGDGIGLGDLHRLQRLEPGFLCNLVIALIRIMLKMSHICYISDITDLIAQVPEESHQYVISHCRSGMSKVRFPVDCGTADIDAHQTRMHRDKFFLSPR